MGNSRDSDVVKFYDNHGNENGKSEKKTDRYGNEYEQYYDKHGNENGKSEKKKDWFGNEYIQYYDKHGNENGRSEKKTDRYGNGYIQYYDKYGNENGKSEEKTDRYGNEYIQYYDKHGNENGKSTSGNWSGTPITGGAVTGAAQFAIIGAVLVGLFYAFQAWRGFAARNETILKLSLEYFVPLLTMVVVAVQCSSEDKQGRLKVAGILEGLIAAVIMGVTQFFGLEMGGPVGDRLYSWVEGLTEGNYYLTIFRMIFPFFMFCLIFLLYPLMGLLFHKVASHLEDEPREIIDKSNPLRVKVLCWITTILYVVLFITINLEDKSTDFVIMDMLFNGVMAALATALMVKLAMRAAGGKKK